MRPLHNQWLYASGALPLEEIEPGPAIMRLSRCEGRDLDQTR
jgi:hypothetical protein